MTDIRIPLSRKRVLDAALDLADAEGVDALSMRKLATSLGFEVMSLYNHVASKDDLILGMVDLVAAEMQRREPEGHWKQAVRDMAISAHDVLLEHRWAAALWSETMPGPHRIDLMEDLLATFRHGGFSPRLAHFGFHAITMHIVGYTLQQLSYSVAAEDLGDLATEFVDSLDSNRYPYLIEHVDYHVHDDEGGDFAFILDLILDGLERSSA